ncbi:hypothetical protein ABDK96_01950 [Citricoccus nitrophenolicus]|uniref:Uncharacterized protein n=1 Tax=Citricoccus nitrophenolicus TaxID=863575 RepID=A0ABV0IED2_9MICC
MSTYRITNNGDRLVAWTNKQITLVITLHRHARVELVKAGE